MIAGDINLLLGLAAGAVCNRARGTKLYGLTQSDTISRVVSMVGLAIITVLNNPHVRAEQMYIEVIINTLLLLLWCVPAWDKYWGAAIGTNGTFNQITPAFAPVDWIMGVIWPKTPTSGFRMRLWGLLAMTLRMSFVMPFYAFQIGLAASHNWVYLASFPLLALTYFVIGFFTPIPKPGKTTTAIRGAEYANGAIIALTVYFIG